MSWVCTLNVRIGILINDPVDHTSKLSKDHGVILRTEFILKTDCYLPKNGGEVVINITMEHKNDI